MDTSDLSETIIDLKLENEKVSSVDKKIKKIWIAYFVILLFVLIVLNCVFIFIIKDDSSFGIGLGAVLAEVIGVIISIIILSIITYVMKKPKKQSIASKNNQLDEQIEEGIINEKIDTYSRFIVFSVFISSLLAAVYPLHICAHIVVLGLFIVLFLTFLRSGEKGRYSNKYLYAYASIILHTIIRFAILLIRPLADSTFGYIYDGDFLKIYAAIQSIIALLLMILIKIAGSKNIKLNKALFIAVSVIVFFAIITSMILG